MPKFSKRTPRGRRARRPVRSSKRAASKKRTTGLSRLRRMIPRAEIKEIRGNWDIEVTAANNPQFATDGVQPLLMGAASGSYFTVQPVQGVGQGNRIGNRVTLVRAVIRGTIFPALYDAVFNSAPRPMIAIIWIFRIKPGNADADSQATAANYCQTQFFQDGNGQTGMTGTIVDYTLPVNRDAIELKKVMKFKLGNARYITPSGTALAHQQDYHNNDFKLFHTFTLNYTKWAKKNISWNDAGAAGPRGMRQLWMAMTVVNADGSNVPTAATPAIIRYNLEFKFKDA